MEKLKDRLFSDIWNIPTLDVHTHIDACHPTANGLHDILLYHMVVTELYSAGCPDGARLCETADREEAEYRLTRAIPYLKYIKGSSLYWGVKTILRDLYGWDEEIALDNWREIDEIIRKKGCTLERAKEIMKKANISQSNTELWRGRDGIADDIFKYSLEWSFFTRSQWGCFDTALLELEYSWNQDIPGPPLPVTVDRSTLNFKKEIHTIEDVDEAIHHYITHIPFDKIANMTSHFSTDIHYREVTADEMKEALLHRDCAGEWERDVYANYINQNFLSALEKEKPGFLMQYSIGAEPLPFETGSKCRTETVYDFAKQAAKYPNLRFALYNANAHQDHAFCTVVRELPNVSIAGYWWHNFFPSKIRDIIEMRLDMVPLNKQFGFFSDAYCMEWSYGKMFLVKKQLAEVLSVKIEQGQYTYEQAIEIAELYLTGAQNA